METIKITETIKNILEHVKQRPGLAKKLTSESDIINEVGLDSLEMVEFMLKLEEGLDIALDFDKLEFSYLSSIGALSDFLATSTSLAASGANASS